MKILKLSAQRHLLITWLIGTFALVVMIIFQQSVGIFGDNSDDLWDWFIPNFFPTLTMMLGAYVAISRQINIEKKMIDKFNYNLCLGGIILYFLLILIVLFTMNLAIDANSKLTPIQHLHNYSKLISAIHGGVTLLLGMFFVQENS